MVTHSSESPGDSEKKSKVMTHQGFSLVGKTDQKTNRVSAMGELWTSCTMDPKGAELNQSEREAARADT